jgi:hypothetical protein
MHLDSVAVTYPGFWAATTPNRRDNIVLFHKHFQLKNSTRYSIRRWYTEYSASITLMPFAIMHACDSETLAALATSGTNWSEAEY